MSRPTLTIDLRGVVLSYADHQVLRIDQLSAKGTVFSLLGHNGAGKSTLIKSLLGVLEPKQGSLRVLTDDGRSLIPERHMAFCPETGAVFADISVEHYIQLWCRVKHGRSDYYRKEGSVYVDKLSVAQLLRKKGRELSKGQRRRVQTALGFMSDPAFFLFDEPFDGLDVHRTNELMEIVEEESDRRVFLLSSHRMDVMERLADYHIVLERGAVRCQGPLGAVLDSLTVASPSETAISLTDAMRAHLRDGMDP